MIYCHTGLLDDPHEIRVARVVLPRECFVTDSDIPDGRRVHNLPCPLIRRKRHLSICRVSQPIRASKRVSYDFPDKNFEEKQGALLYESKRIDEGLTCDIESQKEICILDNRRNSGIGTRDGNVAATEWRHQRSQDRRVIIRRIRCTCHFVALVATKAVVEEILDFRPIRRKRREGLLRSSTELRALWLRQLLPCDEVCCRRSHKAGPILEVDLGLLSAIGDIAESGMRDYIYPVARAKDDMVL